MPNITVNPTRMELTRLKGKLRTAQRGHKLLKDKRDELMKQFLDTVREVRALRQEVEEELMTVHGAFTVASALMSSQALEQALLDPKQSVKLTQTTKNIMSVNVPVYDFQTQTRSDADIYPYGFAATSGELDTAVDALGKVFRKMLKLAEVEKSAQLMAEVLWGFIPCHCSILSQITASQRIIWQSIKKSESSMLTAGNTEIEVRIMLGLFRNGKHWKRGIFWITVISI